MPAPLPLVVTRTARRLIEAHEADRTKIPTHARHGQELLRSMGVPQCRTGMGPTRRPVFGPVRFRREANIA
jgi:hypothetical protein